MQTLDDSTTSLRRILDWPLDHMASQTETPKEKAYSTYILHTASK